MQYLYAIQNKINNKLYIGITNNPKLRWSMHKSVHKTKKSKLYSSMKKYGTDNFEFMILGTHECRKTIGRVEIAYIWAFRTLGVEIYNMTDGGETPPSLVGIKKSAETRAKMSQAQKGRKVTEQTRKKLSQSHMGQVAWNKGTKGKMVDPWNKGLEMSAEHRAKLSAAHIGQVSHNRMLTFETAQEIRTKYKAGVTRRQLCDEYGFGKSVITGIVTNKTYKN